MKHAWRCGGLASLPSPYFFFTNYISTSLTEFKMLSPVMIKVYEMDQVLRDHDLYTSVRALTINPWSGMNKAINNYVGWMTQRHIDAKAIMAYSGKDAVAWALYATDRSTDVVNYDPKDGTVCFQVFVREDCRRQGIGSQLMAKAVEIDKNKIIRVYEWNNPEFFYYNRSMRGFALKNIWADV